MSWIMRSITTVSFCTRGHERPQPAGLDEDGRGHQMLRARRTAPLNRSTWPTCRTAPVRAAIGEQLARLLERRRHRLLDEHADPRLQQVAGHVEVLLGRHRHAGHVDQADQRPVVVEGARLVAGRHRAGPAGVDVGDADQLDVGQLGVDEHVVLPHVAGADHAGPDASVDGHQDVTSSVSAADSSDAPGPLQMPWRVAPAMKSSSVSTGGLGGSSSRMRSTAAGGDEPAAVEKTVGVLQDAAGRPAPSPARRIPITFTPAGGGRLAVDDHVRRHVGVHLGHAADVGAGSHARERHHADHTRRWSRGRRSGSGR